MGRIRLSTYIRIKQILVVCMLCVCVLMLLIAAGFSSPPTGNKVDVITDLSDYVSRQLRFTNVQRVSNVTTASPNVTTTTAKVVPDLFRDWFDQRRNVKPFRTTQEHPYLPAYLINSDVCKDTDVDILIYFNSASDHFQRRRFLREMWASTKTFKDIKIKVIFIIGEPRMEETKLAIKNERLVHGDVIQGDFLDTFRNLTYKAMLALKWINDNCIHARYVIKADDDMFVNIFKVIEDIIPTMSLHTRTVFCHYHKAGTSKIIRNSKDKWYVPDSILSNRTTFPDFCSGYTVIMTTDVIPLLYESSFQSPYLSIDDVYMFGVLPLFSKKLKYIDGKKYFSLNGKAAKEQYTGSGDITYIVAPAYQDDYYTDYWSATLSKLSKWAQRHANIVTLRRNMGPKKL